MSNEPIVFQEIEIVDSTGTVKVVLEHIGEGYSGDYDIEDPDDEQLIRFTILKREFGSDIFLEVDDASYCTELSVRSDREQLLSIANSILKELAPFVVSGSSIKKLCERLSWISL